MTLTGDALRRSRFGTRFTAWVATCARCPMILRNGCFTRRRRPIGQVVDVGLATRLTSKRSDATLMENENFGVNTAPPPVGLTGLQSRTALRGRGPFFVPKRWPIGWPRRKA
jgi:hypothetical protein